MRFSRTQWGALVDAVTATPIRPATQREWELSAGADNPEGIFQLGRYADDQARMVYVAGGPDVEFNADGRVVPILPVTAEEVRRILASEAEWFREHAEKIIREEVDRILSGEVARNRAAAEAEMGQDREATRPACPHTKHHQGRIVPCQGPFGHEGGHAHITSAGMLVHW